MQEVKDSVFSIKPDSSPGPDGFNGKFYQSAWNIIVNDLHNAITFFFRGATLPKFFTHTCVIMLPKNECPQIFSDIRIISLCNMSSKIIVKLLNARLGGILPKIISQNQSGFVKGRAIIVIKLDRTKEYVRVSWPFLCFMLRKLGFAESWTNLIFRFISNNWYTILVKRSRHDFFKSGRGLRQEDPLSTSLFILLSLIFNELHHNNRFKGFYMNKQRPKVNHLAFADDTIVFSNGSRSSLNLIFDTLAMYEKVFGQSINRNKCSLSLAHNASQRSIEDWKNFKYEV